MESRTNTVEHIPVNPKVKGLFEASLQKHIEDLTQLNGFNVQWFGVLNSDVLRDNRTVDGVLTYSYNLVKSDSVLHHTSVTLWLYCNSEAFLNEMDALIDLGYTQTQSTVYDENYAPITVFRKNVVIFI